MDLQSLVKINIELDYLQTLASLKQEISQLDEIHLAADVMNLRTSTQYIDRRDTTKHINNFK